MKQEQEQEQETMVMTVPPLLHYLLTTPEFRLFHYYQFLPCNHSGAATVVITVLQYFIYKVLHYQVLVLEHNFDTVIIARELQN